MTIALFMLRCVDLELNIVDLDLLTIGSVNDIYLKHPGRKILLPE